MPPPRFKIRSLMIAVAVAAVISAAAPALWWLWPARRSDAWSAGKDVPLIVTVVDAGDGRPIAGATVRIVHPFGRGMMPPARDETGAGGRAELIAVANAQGTVLAAVPPCDPSGRIVLRKAERTSLAGGTVAASAAGYDEDRVDLDAAASRSPVVVRLRKSPAR